MFKALLVVGALAASTMIAAAQTPATTPARPATPPAAATTPAPALLDINSATRAELMTLTGIGEARADAIIRGRPYRGKDDLTNKSIIPEGVYNGIKDRIIARQR